MDQQAVFEIVKRNVLDILPDVTEDQVATDVALKDLGANSLDRVDVATMSMEDMGIHMPMMELANVENIGDLVSVLHAKKASQ